MHPILFNIGPIMVYSYGVMLVIAFFTARSLALKRAYLFNISKEAIGSLSFLLLITGIIGARLFYVLFNIKYFLNHPLESLLINKGGLVFHGGFLVAFIAGIIFTKFNNLSIFDTADLLSPCVTVAHAIGRIGCFLNGCCYGKPTSLFFGVTFPGTDSMVYPTQLFSSAGLFIISILLFYRQEKKGFKGDVLSFYFILYGILRFLIDFLRGDTLPVLYGLTTAQFISIGFVITGFCLYLIRTSYERDHNGQSR